MAATVPADPAHRHADGQIGLGQEPGQAVGAYACQILHGWHTEVIHEHASELRGRQVNLVREIPQTPVPFWM